MSGQLARRLQGLPKAQHIRCLQCCLSPNTLNNNQKGSIVSNHVPARSFSKLSEINDQILEKMKELEAIRAMKLEAEASEIEVSSEKVAESTSGDGQPMGQFYETWKTSDRTEDWQEPQGKQVQEVWDGCTAAAHVAYSMSEDCFIFPITPSSPMAETAEAWMVARKNNTFGDVLNVQQMQSEAGAAGAVHGSVVMGRVGTTFTSSQGLLLMIPNMYKIAGELTPCVFHIAARALAGEALSIFGDHQDVMAARATGWAMVFGQGVQDSQDVAIAAHMATLIGRVPILAIQDGFRTSHEFNTIQITPTEEMRQLLDPEALAEFRDRGLSPLSPIAMGSNQNPDVYMQCVEGANTFYDNFADIFEETCIKLSKFLGRPLSLFKYYGHPEADHIVVQMGSAVTVSEDILSHAMLTRDAKLAVLSPYLFRPWCVKRFLASLPKSVKSITVLDRTKEHGSYREPMFLDVAASIQQSTEFSHVKLLGGRYGLGSKEYTPAMALSVFDNALSENPKDPFVVGIEDDVTFLSLPISPVDTLQLSPNTTHCMFFGLAGDGTVGANKNAVKIIGDNSDLMAQAYFAYSSVKAGAPTISHLRFGPEIIDMPYLIQRDQASYVACTNTNFAQMFDMVEFLKPDTGIFVLNCPWDTVELVEEFCPTHMLKSIAEKNITFYTLDATQVAKDCGLAGLTNNIMQTCFFKLSEVLPFELALDAFRNMMQKSYIRYGEEVVEKNLNAVDQALAKLTKIEIQDSWNDFEDASLPEALKYVGKGDFAEDVQAPMMMLKGDDVPVSAFPLGGISELGLTNNEKKAYAPIVPEVDMDICTQCNYCSYVCPHATIRPFLLTQQEFDTAPESLDARKAVQSEMAGYYYRIQVSAGDCTGCDVCVKMCPDDALYMVPQEETGVEDYNHHEHWDFLRALPTHDDLMKKTSLKGSQHQQPLLEFHAACNGCGETPYVTLLTQMYGDRLVIANATGCSSIWGNPYGSTPYATRESDGKGPAWANSLFEDNAEFGFGIALADTARRSRLYDIIEQMLSMGIVDSDRELRANLKLWFDKWQDSEVCSKLSDILPVLIDIAKERGIEDRLADDPMALTLFQDLDMHRKQFLKKAHWIVGGDGWAYDIGFGGLDHVIASGADINVMVLDTEVYSNTGGQKSKASPAASLSKFALGGKERQKKNLADILMAYNDVYVAQISMGAQPAQTAKAIAESTDYFGASLVIAYSPCIEFKITHEDGLGNMISCQKLAVSSGYWPLFRYDPRLETPMQLDQKILRDDLALYLSTEDRFNSLMRANRPKFDKLVQEMRVHTRRRHQKYTAMAAKKGGGGGPPLNILFGSETGNTAELAARFAGMCKNRGYDVELAEMDDVSVDEIQVMKNVVLMIATAGEGALPQNARTLWHELSVAEPDCFEGLKFSVFALGDKGYRHFCSSGYEYMEKFTELGAECIQEIGIGDDKDEDKYETGFAEWMPEYYKIVNAPDDPAENDPPQPLFELTPAEEIDVFDQLSVQTRTQKLNIDFNNRITESDYEFSIRHIQFDAPNLPYLLGDALAVHPENCDKKVDYFLEEYGIDGTACYSAQVLPGADAGRKAEQMETAFRVKQLFIEMLDIEGRPTKNFVKALWTIAPEGSADRKKLRELVDDGEMYTKEIAAESLTISEVLLMFKDTRATLDQLISMVPVIKPRLYTIASSTRHTPGKVELTVITDEWEGASGNFRRGLCTDFFERMDSADHPGVTFAPNCSITPGSFEFPESTTPYVMAGTGTGVAPFLAFAYERDWFVKKYGQELNGDMWLFYGCRQRSKDYILGDELEDLSDRGVLSHLMPAFSRDQGEKVYIQDKIIMESEGVYDALVIKKGYLYLCGQAGDREQDVLDAVSTTFEKAGGMSPEEAKKELDALIDDGRYCPELY